MVGEFDGQLLRQTVLLVLFRSGLLNLIHACRLHKPEAQAARNGLTAVMNQHQPKMSEENNKSGRNSLSKVLFYYMLCLGSYLVINYLGLYIVAGIY